MDQAFNQPNHLQTLPHGELQLHPILMQPTQGYSMNNNRQGHATSGQAVQGDPNTTFWVQNELITKILEAETKQHNETRSDLNLFRTRCFRLEQNIALEQEHKKSLQIIINNLRIECHKNEIGRMEAESRIQELQNANCFPISYPNATEEGNFINPQRDSSLSSYRSPTFSPTLSPLEEFHRMKRPSPPESRALAFKRVRITSGTAGLSGPLTSGTAMDHTE